MEDGKINTEEKEMENLLGRINCDGNIQTLENTEANSFSQSSVPPTPRRFWASRAAASASSPPSFRSVSASPRTRSPCTPPRSRTAVSPPSLSASPSVTSCLTVWPSAVPAMVSSVSSWRAALRVARLLFRASSVLLAPSP